MTARVVTSDQAAARDAAAIAAGIPSLQLMRRAGAGAARVILDRFAPARGRRALVCCGPGNNGGDGWIVAAELARAGMLVHVEQVLEPRTTDATTAREDALPFVALGTPASPPDVVVDALLGTGAQGPLRGAVAESATRINEARRHGAIVVALDLPSGVDASTGELAPGAVRADLTITFGTVKRGQLLSRSACGEIVALDIGLGEHADLADGAPVLIDRPWVAARVPPIAAEAHKGTRRRLLIVGGDRGMAGAVSLAARGALHAGIGMVKVCVHEASVAPLQASVAEATAAPWPDGPPDEALVAWPHVLLIGPGLGAGAGGRERVTRWLTSWSGPVMLDADALNAFAGDETALGDLLDGRNAIVTPHPLEFARLIGVDLDTVLDERFEVGARLARALHATVILKGVPTVVTAPDGESVVCAAGTPVLGTAGSGDLLAGIAATLLAQGGDPFAAAACAAWIHGKAGELANAGRPVRGVTLDDVLRSLNEAWRLEPAPSDDYLARLPRVGDT
ncbi:MAG: NAD(P)H-hydrate dehydratase [Gemmatimonadetes bacterium]|nr:NAD(P)H-hydrate dehydratase [Gemmatimonadota bacterium]